MTQRKPNLADDRAKLRIITQHREKDTMVYEMECNGVELDIRISPGKTGDNGEGWVIEARLGRASGATCVTEQASTRREALSEVAREWASSASDRALPAFDWDAVAGVLTTVRAL